MFPEKTKFLKRSIGWKNLGKTKSSHTVVEGKVGSYFSTHALCGSILYVGREGEELFTFCPRCLIKVK